jgi:hypothetical protein
MDKIINLSESELITIEDEVVTYDESEYKILKIGGEINEVLDVTRMACDSLDIARFLFAASEIDSSCIPDDDQFSVLLTLDFGVEVQTDELIEPISELLIFKPREANDCKSGPISFVRVFRYSELTNDFLLLPQSFDTSERDSANFMNDVYSMALAGSGDRETMDFGNRYYGAIACEHCDLEVIEESQHCQTLPSTTVEGLREEDGNIGQLLLNALSSLDSNQEHFRETVRLIAEICQSLDLLEDEDLSAELENTLTAIPKSVRDLWTESINS